MRKILTNKKLAAVAVAAVAVTGTGVAYAYWTTTGGGTGQATAGNSNAPADAIDITQTPTQAAELTGFYPGGSAVNVNVDISNPAPYSQRVGNVTVTAAAVGGCAASNWVIADVAETNSLLTKADAVATSDEVSNVTVATIRLDETGVNQDACQNVQPVLTFVSAPGA